MGDVIRAGVLTDATPGDPRPVLVVTGTRREGAAAAGPGICVLACGGDHAALIERLKEEAPRAAGIVSFGMAGALAPELRIGDWVIATSMTGVFAGQSDARWAGALAARLPVARLGAVHAEGRLAGSLAEKSAMARASGALAVDMESHIAAAAAEWAGIPFVALRCISDRALAALPPAVAVAMRGDGGIALGAVLGSLLRHPGQIPALVGTVRGFAAADRALRAGAGSLPDRLGFDAR